MTHPIGTTQADHGTICGRSCANSGHYKPLCAYVDRTFVNSKFVAPASRKNSFPPAGWTDIRPDLAGASLSDAILSGADLTKADLRGADLTKADLRGADLSGARLHKSNFFGADLTK